MSERKYLNLSKLRIWSDNPRYGNANSNTLMDEKEAINLLIEVVGEIKMLNLVLDIISSKGLNGNVMPTVVEKDGLFLVYDGNRRISCMKILESPSLIENKFSSLRDKIIKAKSRADLSFLNSVFVYITDENEALLLMDKTHSGEQDGVGVLSWDAFNRDISLIKRNQSPLYPISLKIAQILNLKYKKDFKPIYYTDYQRLFGSKPLLTAFGIEKLDESNKRNIETCKAALLLYKQSRGFNSFSRQFNITSTSDDAESTKPINDFIAFWKEKQLSESSFQITIDSRRLFNDCDYSFDLSSVHIFNKKKQKEITPSLNEIQISYFDPTGKKKKDLDIRIGGIWFVEIVYKGIAAKGKIEIVAPFSEPRVSFDDSKLMLKEGATANLKLLVLSAKSVHNNDMPLLRVKPTNSSSTIIDSGFSFSYKNKVGVHGVSFIFDNDGEEFAIAKSIMVLSSLKPMTNKTKNVPFSFNGKFEISFSSEVASLVTEINELWENADRFRHVLACSGRSVAELSLDFVSTFESSILAGELGERIKTFANYLLDKDNGKLKQITDKLRISFRTTENELVQLRDNADFIAKALHLGAHKSSSSLDSQNLFDKLHVYVCLIIKCAEGLS